MLNRRDFLKQAAALSALFAAAPRKASARLATPMDGKTNAVRFSVCIDMIMSKMPFLERMERVKQLGYPAFEFWEWKNKDVEAILRKKNELKLEIATIMGSGWKTMNTEEARKAFASEIQASVATAKKLGCKTLIVTTGSEDKNIGNLSTK